MLRYTFYLLAIWSIPTFAGPSLSDRVSVVAPSPSVSFREATTHLEESVRTLALGHTWVARDRFRIDFASFVFNLKRQTRAVARQDEVLRVFAKFCRDELPESVPEIVDILSGEPAFRAALAGAHHHPRRPVDLRGADIVSGVAQTAAGIPLVTLSAILIPLTIFAPIFNGLNGTFVSGADDRDIDGMFSWLKRSGRLTTDGIGRIMGQMPAKSLLKKNTPAGRATRTTCEALIES